MIELALKRARQDAALTFTFDTNILQDYTLSTTDIMGAQEAMACVLSSESELMGD